MCGTLVAIAVIDLELPAAVGLDADRFQAQVVGVARAAVGPQQDVGLELLAALEVQDHAVVGPFDLLVLLAVADQRAFLAEVIAQGVADLVVEKLQQLVARVDQVQLAAQVAEHRGIFAADDARPVDRDRPGRERRG